MISSAATAQFDWGVWQSGNQDAVSVERQTPDSYKPIVNTDVTPVRL